MYQPKENKYLLFVQGGAAISVLLDKRQKWKQISRLGDQITVERKNMRISMDQQKLLQYFNRITQ